MKKQKYFIFLSVIFLIIIISGVLFYFYKANKAVVVDWNNVNKIFDIEIPEDFDEGKVERLNEKISQAKSVYSDRAEDNWSWVALGNLYEFAHDYERAVLAYEESLKMSPYDITSTLSLASLYEKYLGDLSKAEFYYKKALEINSDSPDLFNRLAKFYYQKLDNYKQAEIIYLEGLEKTNNHSDLLVDVIRFYDKYEKVEEEVFYAKRLLSLYPDNHFFQNDFGDLVKE